MSLSRGNVGWVWGRRERDGLSFDRTVDNNKHFLPRLGGVCKWDVSVCKLGELGRSLQTECLILQTGHLSLSLHTGSVFLQTGRLSLSLQTERSVCKLSHFANGV